nr:MAG TPA: hypothetical protein [Caudoviricetes sp.]
MIFFATFYRLSRVKIPQRCITENLKNCLTMYKYTK